MKIYAIKDDTLPKDKILGYLIYYELQNSFYIELPDDADRWETPMILSSFVEKGIYSIDSYWSKIWVMQRIVPQDRQNIAQIICDNHLKEYDEYRLLMLANGRCEQDDCYLEDVALEELPSFIKERWQTKINDILPLKPPQILIFFRNEIAGIVDVDSMGIPECRPYLTNNERFNTVEVQPDGYGVYWNERATISYSMLYSYSSKIPLSLADLHDYIKNRTVSSSQVCDILECSRQNVDDLVRRGKIQPIRTDAKYKLFSKTDVLQRISVKE